MRAQLKNASLITAALFLNVRYTIRVGCARYESLVQELILTWEKRRVECTWVVFGTHGWK